ncbi:uncharacterized protein C3orf67 homolog isoform X2 [Trichomycterus rosablanca]|uniref:uncharacterized protein C3orf67 homolog isoform X2 n=1 Tax=Trichomycterus rosablanca TaxID=2290929 RepID=UPI002F354BE6
MFKNEYQGGAVVEIFSAQGKDPVAKWKLSGQPSISKVFDKEVKGFVYILEGSSQTHRMQLPKDGKTPLVLIQKFLVLQVNVPSGKDFSTELVVTDQGHLKRRLYLSTVHKEFSATPLHARIPLTSLRRDIWCNLCIDLGSFSAELFRGASFLSLDGIIISACCKVRRIFTMRTVPSDHVDRDLYDMKNDPKEDIPRSCQFPLDVQHITQLLNMERLKPADLRSASISSKSEQPLSAKAYQHPKTQDGSHIAFGSKVTGRPPLTARKSSLLSTRTDNSAKSSPKSTSQTGRSGYIKSQSATDQASFERTGSGRPRLVHNARTERLAARNHVMPQSSPDAEKSIDEDTSADHLIPRRADTSASSRPLECKSPSSSLSNQHMLKYGNNDTMETVPQLSLIEAEEDGEEVFTFSSRPHSAKSCQSFCDAFGNLSVDIENDSLMQEGDRKEARLEDDFVGGDGEEDESYFGFLSQRFAVHSSPSPPTPASVPVPRSSSTPRLSADPARSSPVPHTSPACSSETSRRTEMVRVQPTRCLSPSAARVRSRPERPGPERTRPDGDMRKSISRTSVREIPPEDVRLHKVRDSKRGVPVGSSTFDLSRRPEQDEEVEEEELRMLASLRRQKEEEEVSTSDPGLSASQVE